MKAKTATRILSLLLCLVMLVGLIPTSVWAYWEEPSAEGDDSLETIVHDYTAPVGVTMERLTGSCVTETDNMGDDLLFVIKSGDRYYAMKDVAASEDARDAIPAVDVTEWVNADGTLTVPADTRNVAFWRYETRPDYEYGMFINGREDYLAYTSSYESVDGDDDYYNDAERTYWGKFKVRTFEEGQWIFDPYYWSENGTSGTLRFNGGWDEMISSYNRKRHTYNVIADLRSNGIGGKEFYFRYLGTDVDYTGDEVEGYLYYADCRHQYTVRHAEYDAPTCMLKGCEEYWYCEGCDEYFKDEAMTQLWGENMPVIPATGHDWDSEKCANCGRPVPVYSRVTNQADFNALADDTMFILVSEYDGKYYVPDLTEMYLYTQDSDGDGYCDIHNVDENGNGTPDYLEFDDDGDGVYDYLTWDMDNDGDVDEDDYLAFSEMICGQYLVDRLYNNDGIGATEVSINSDGTFSHGNVKATVEFEMVDLFLSDEIDAMIEDLQQYEAWWTDDMRYTYECVKQFVVPNTFITAPSMAPVERQYKQRIADYGDTYSWGVLFYNDASNYKVYDYETESVVQPAFHDVCTQDSVVVFPTFDYMWYDSTWNRQLGQLRLRDYNGQLTFVTGDDYALEGGEYVEDPVTGEGYWDTHDTQAAVYLYASEQPSHVCEFGDWVDNADGTRTGTCECGETRTENHGWNNGEETKAPTCTEEGIMAFTCAACGATKTEAIKALGHDWSDWVDDGENAAADTHSHTCRRNCGVAAERENHDWSAWTSVGDVHQKICSVCNGIRTDAHKWDDGVVTKEPTHYEEGIKTYTCTVCSGTKTEPIAKTAAHEWTDWSSDGDDTHSRTCPCGQTETADCAYDDGVVTKQPTHTETGIRTYTCTLCGHTYDESIPVLTDHAWGEWVLNKEDETTHIRFCVCNESQTAPHRFDEGKIVKQPTHTQKGVMTYTCGDCGYSYDVEIPETTEHQWADWSSNGDGTHSRTCPCGETETADCAYDDGVVIRESSHTQPGLKVYTCGDCGYAVEETIPALEEHEWGEWVPEDEESHVRACACNATETAAHTWSRWQGQNDGSYVRICGDCGIMQTVTFSEDAPVNTTPDDNAAGAELKNTDQELFENVLTEEDRSMLAQGSDVSVYLVVKDISAEVPAAHKAAAEANAGAAQIAMYLDIDLFKKVDDAVTQIRQTNGMVTVTITIPEALRNTDADVERSYKIVRVHEDAAGNLITDVIEGIYHDDDATFTFQTDKFSTYSLAYTDKTEEKIPGSPETGDNSMLGLWLALLVISGGAAIMQTAAARKRRNAAIR